jgi:phytoene dehydrogenase-like protein
MKIVVIGAGMGGMTAAARLSRGGHEVVVYEASDQVGGNVAPNGLAKLHLILGHHY